MKLFSRILVISAMIFTCATAKAQLPSVDIKTLDGKTVSAQTINNDGKPYVVSFFATWCKPCLRELKAINENYADWVDETGMKLVAISTDQGQAVSRVKPLVDSEGWEYEVYIDDNGELMRTLGIQNIPHLMIIDGNGNIVESHSGYTEGSEEHVIQVIRDLITK